jgi:hypothetical protein
MTVLAFAQPYTAYDIEPLLPCLCYPPTATNKQRPQPGLMFNWGADRSLATW